MFTKKDIKSGKGMHKKKNLEQKLNFVLIKNLNQKSSSMKILYSNLMITFASLAIKNI